MKRHLLVRTSGRTACGLPNSVSRTVIASEVTCETCKRSLRMADKEVEQRLDPRK